MIRRFAASGALLAAVGLLVAGCGSTGTTAGPAPTTPARAAGGVARNSRGPFAVGMRTETFTDTSRKTPANGSVQEKPSRTLETLIMYPAQGTPDPDHEVEGATPASGRFPMVVYVHGFSAHAANPYLHYWAAAGFVAVAPSFPLTNTDAAGGPNIIDAVNEPGDVSFVISGMLHLSAGEADVQRIIDPEAVAVMGTSLGAGVAHEVAYNSRSRDPRVKAALEVAGGCSACAGGVVDPGETSFAGTSVPLMLIHGTADPAVPYQGSVQEFARAPSPKYLVTLTGAKHVQFDQPWETIAARSTIDFLDRYLKHEDDGLRRLTADANVPNVASLQQSPA